MYETKIQLVDDCWYRVITGGLVDQAGNAHDAQRMGRLQRAQLEAEDRARYARRLLDGSERARRECEQSRVALLNDHRELQKVVERLRHEITQVRAGFDTIVEQYRVADDALRAKQPATLWRKGPPPKSHEPSICAYYMGGAGKWTAAASTIGHGSLAHIPLSDLPGLEQFVPQPVEAERKAQRFKWLEGGAWQHGCAFPVSEDMWQVEAEYYSHTCRCGEVQANAQSCADPAPVVWIDSDYTWSQS
jgi:hypothetical protein